MWWSPAQQVHELHLVPWSPLGTSLGIWAWRSGLPPNGGQPITPPSQLSQGRTGLEGRTDTIQGVSTPQG